MKELEDFDWFPVILRKYQMEYIGIISSQFGFYKRVAQMIKSDLNIQHITRVEDLCSGSGLPAIFIHHEMGETNVHTALSDKYPQKIQNIKGVHYHSAPLDVLNIQMEKGVYYTMYNAFHHFDLIEQKKIIQNALDNKANLKIVELVQPTLLNVFSITLASTLGVWLFCLLIRPFEWKRFLFTYLIPINVLTVLIDGWITIFKSKTVSQYKTNFDDLFPNNNSIIVSSHWRFPARLVTIKITPAYD